MKSESLRYWRRILVGNVIASLFVLFAFTGMTWRSPIGQVARGFGISFLYSMFIGPLLGFAMPRIAPWIWARIRFPLNWVAVSAAMALLAMAGSVGTIAVLIVFGVVAPGEFIPWLRGSLRVSIAVTLTIGLFITAYEVMRARVAQATAQAQLASLEARVQPHFLFNTLNSIAALIHEDPKGAERMTEQLASLLRSSLEQQPAPLVTLEDELRVVRNYLAIEQVRLGDRLRYSIDIDEVLGQMRIPRLALQTLVENSVKYAVSPRREGGSIAVAAADNRTGLRITVEDDGPGFDGRELPAGHGLALLRDRLGLLFSDHASLVVSCTPGCTRVSLTLPHTHDAPGRLVDVNSPRECA